MASHAFSIAPRYRVVVGLIVLVLGAFELFKMYQLQRMKAEIAQLESQLGQGQGKAGAVFGKPPATGDHVAALHR